MIPQTTQDNVGLVTRQNALTLQQPNERELKNETRWIYCFNLWTELVSQQLDLLAPDEGQNEMSASILPIPKLNHNCETHNNRNGETKEALLAELQSHVVTKAVQTISKVKTIRRIKEIGIKLDIWEFCRTEGVVFLSCLQIRSCEHQTGERELSKESYKMLESLKIKMLDKIVTMCQNIDFYMQQLQEALSIFKNHRCHGLFIDPVVVKSMEKFKKRNSQPFVIPGHSRISEIESSVKSSKSAHDIDFDSKSEPVDPWKESSKRSSNKSKSKNSASKTSSTWIPDVPDFTEPLFSKLKPLRIKSTQNTTKNGPNDDQTLHNCPQANYTIREVTKRYLHLILQGTEWYFRWSEFTEKVLKEIKNLASEVLTYMTKHINRQINLLKSLFVECRCVAEKTKTMTSRRDEMQVTFTLLSILDDFVSLIESIKHESSFLIRYVEIALINLGVLDFNVEPVKLHPLRLYLMRNVISMKDCQLLTSIDYLYPEMGFLLEFIEFRFHQEKDYLEKFGHITADLLKKYTMNRKEVIQEKEFTSIQNVNKLELENELLCTDDVSNLNTSRSPLARYQRAEDLRKWVEDSKTMVQTSMAHKSTNGAKARDRTIKKLTKVDVTNNPNPDNSSDDDAPGTNMPTLEEKEDFLNGNMDHKGKTLQKEKHVRFWQSTKTSAHNLGKDLKKKLTRKK